METKKYCFFEKIGDNDLWEGNCMSLVCDETHKLRKNHIHLGMYTSDMDYVQFFDVFDCQLKERKTQCGFCKVCFSCKRFRLLCYQWDGIVFSSNQKNEIYCTAVWFCQQNLKHPKTDCRTLDFLSSGPVDNDFINFIEEKEKILLEIANEFQKVKVW